MASAGVADEAKAKGQQAMDQATERGQQAKEKLDQAAEMVRERAPQGGAVGNVATTAADTLGSASSYLRDKDSSKLMDDLENLIRRKPTESLLAAAGLWFVLSKILK